jgi:hypothetical protein
MANARIMLHKIILTKGYMISRHQAMINIRINIRIVMSYTELLEDRLFMTVNFKDCYA